MIENTFPIHRMPTTDASPVPMASNRASGCCTVPSACLPSKATPKRLRANWRRRPAPTQPPSATISATRRACTAPPSPINYLIHKTISPCTSSPISPCAKAWKAFMRNCSPPCSREKSRATACACGAARCSNRRACGHARSTRTSVPNTRRSRACWHATWARRQQRRHPPPGVFHRLAGPAAHGGRRGAANLASATAGIAARHRHLAGAHDRLRAGHG